MARPKNDHTYRDHIIRPCAQVGIGKCTGMGWYIEAQDRGLYYAEEHCHHYPTLAEAKASIEEWLSQKEAEEKLANTSWGQELARYGLPPDATLADYWRAKDDTAEAAYQRWAAKWSLCQTLTTTTHGQPSPGTTVMTASGC